MNTKWRILKHGMKNHPAIGVYAMLQFIFMMAGFQSKEGKLWYFGLITLPILFIMFIVTSYTVGKANWDFNKNMPLDYDYKGEI